MAGAGFKDFSVGEVLTASDVDTYLMQQSVMNFADSAARGSALGTATGTAVPLAEGMVSYLQDTDSVEVYDGSAWVSVAPDQNVVQIVATTYSTQVSWTTSGWQDTGLSLSITPTSVSNKVLVLVSQTARLLGANPGERYLDCQILRDSTSVIDYDPGIGSADQSVNDNVYATIPFTYLDSPATASAVTYKTQLRIDDATFSPVGYAQPGSNISQIVLMEVVA